MPPASAASRCDVGYVIVPCLSLSVCDNCFLRQIVKLNFCYMLTSSQEEKPCKGRGRKWKRLFYCPVVSLFLPTITRERSRLCRDLFLQLQGAAPIAPRISDPTTVWFRGTNSCPEAPRCSTITPAVGSAPLKHTSAAGKALTPAFS